MIIVGSDADQKPQLDYSCAIPRFWRSKEDSQVTVEIKTQTLVDGRKRRVNYRNAIEVGLIGDDAPTYAMWLNDFKEEYEPVGNKSDHF